MFVRQSGSGGGAGEGLWAKTDIGAGQLCALFNGVRVHRSEESYLALSSAQMVEFKLFKSILALKEKRFGYES